MVACIVCTLEDSTPYMIGVFLLIVFFLSSLDLCECITCVPEGMIWAAGKEAEIWVQVGSGRHIHFSSIGEK